MKNFNFEQVVLSAVHLGMRWLIGLTLMSCAGPMNPFGSIEIISNQGKSISSLNRSIPANNFDSNAEVKYFPSRQNWHDSTEFKIIINDNTGILPTHKLNIFYNELDITTQILSQSIIEMNDNNTVMTISLRDLRLLPDRNNIITTIYQRDSFTKNVVTTYQNPSCDINAIQSVRSPASFKSKMALLKTVERVSLQHGANPAFIAGLIAQESGFNPRAVSWAKAIGLTQVTSLAESDILNEEEWPRYPKLNSLSVAKIKALIYFGKLNKKNEWRLDEEKSIVGGIEYLNYIQKYWKSPLNYKRVNNKLNGSEQNMNDIILASYNSGPYRVKREILKNGSDWLSSNKLKEARRYVGKVKSYCYHFAMAQREVL